MEHRFKKRKNKKEVAKMKRKKETLRLKQARVAKALRDYYYGLTLPSKESLEKQFAF